MTAPLYNDPAPGTVGLDEHGNLVDIGTQVLRKRQRELFAANPHCGICGGEIANIEDCSPVRLANGEVYLCHNTSKCFWKSIDGMIRRYAEPRRTA